MKSTSSIIEGIENKHSQQILKSRRKDSSRERESGKRNRKREDRERRLSVQRESDLKQNEFDVGETIERTEHAIVDIRQNDISTSRFSTLNAGKLYVQAGDNFQTIQMVPVSASSEIWTDQSNNTQISKHGPIIFAILLQRLFYSIGFISRGFLAGMALTHSLMIHIFAETSKNPHDPLVSQISDLYNSIFWSLLVLCLTSVFDKIRTSSDGECLCGVAAVVHAKSILALPFYLIVLVLQLISSHIDPHYVADFTNVSSTGADQFSTWLKIATIKDTSAILAWLLECFDSQPEPDGFLHNLEAMSKS